MSQSRKIKKPPFWLKNRLLIKLFQSRLGTVLSNWITQCMLYAEPVEIMFRLTLEITVCSLLVLGCVIFFKTLQLKVFLLILLITHTITFFINGQLFVLARFLGYKFRDPEFFIGYPLKIKMRLEKRESVLAIAVFGGLSKGLYSETSDLDMRVIARSGFVNNFVACYWVFLERLLALFYKYPLDVYVVTGKSGLEKLNTDEIPVVLFDKGEIIAALYPVSFDYGVVFKRILGNSE
jgi:L-malate glycosyltransferase